MTDHLHTPPPSLNGRVGALVLLVCAPLNLFLHTEAATLGPLSFVAWLGVSFGVLCFCDEMGAGRPLNRAGLVLFAAAFCAETLTLLAVDPAVAARARLLYAFAVLAALVFWSVALMHRPNVARAIGAAGVAVGGGAIVLLVAAHLLLGTATVMGFSGLFAALADPGHATGHALLLVDSLLCGWSLMAASLLWTGRLRT
jgi:hypothetical protein